MSTSQGGLASYLLYAVVYVVGLGAVYASLGGGPVQRLRHPAPAVVLLSLVVAVPSLVGLAWQPLFDALARDPELVRHGELWRLVSYVAVQDDGVGGTIYNLVTLALTLPAAVVLWRPAATLGLFVAGALVFSLPAVFVWPHAGAGNSGATFFLAGSMVGALSVRRRDVRRAAAVTALAGAALLVLGDAHGEAVLAGLVIGSAFANAVQPTARPASVRP